jgi:hypothetical protein
MHDPDRRSDLASDGGLGNADNPARLDLLTTEIAKIRRECKRVVSLSNQEAD